MFIPFTTILNQKRILLNRLLARKRVQITSPDYLKNVHSILLIIPILGLVLTSVILFSNRLSFINLAFGIIITAASIASYLYLRKHIQSTSVKGGTLILNSFDHKSKVTSLRSIKRIQTKSALGMQWTSLSYNLDGRDRNAIIVNKASSVAVLPETAIKKAIELNKKEKESHRSVYNLKN